MAIGTRLASALAAKAHADKEKALLTLELLTTNAVGVGDHSFDDLIGDAEKALSLLSDADDKLETISKYFKSSEENESGNENRE